MKLAQYIQAGEADWIQRDLEDHPIVFRRQLRDLAVSSPHLLLPLVQLRLINRWLRVSQGATLPFPKLYIETFGHSFSLENLQTDFALLDEVSQLDASSIPPNEGSDDTTPIEVEIILAMAELILGSTAPMIYSSDTALYSLTAQPVFAIPSRFQSRYLASASLRHALWGTTMLGNTVWEELRKILAVAVEALNPDKETVDPALSPELTNIRSNFTRWLDVMQAMELAEEIDALNIEPTIRSTATSRSYGSTSPPPLVAKPVTGSNLVAGAPSITITTCNLNGFNDKDDTPAATLGKLLHQCVFFQETKIKNKDHFHTIRRHITNHIGHKKYRLFVNDHRTSTHGSTNHRSKGVATFFHESMPGFANLKPLWDKLVQDRYLVIHTTWNSTPVYFHNVYAPVEDDQRAAFFESLPVDFGDDDTGIHIVGGDFNLPMITSLDATTPPSNYNAGKAECLA
ncbi:hypothetical protein AC1031_000307 [Aphanomyces cochlioides]|nr:hypothetical protein AC1031_000307 [Aphanomyces cochlioides]